MCVCVGGGGACARVCVRACLSDGHRGVGTTIALYILHFMETVIPCCANTAMTMRHELS